MTRFNQVLTSSFCAAILTSSVANAVLLTGSGSHLPLPSAGPPSALPTTAIGNMVGGPWQGSWAAPALPAWIGSYNVGGPQPAGTSNNTGTSEYSFTSMPNGELSIGTYFRFGDVDQGSGTSESFTLTAYNSMGQITTPWLDEPMWVSGTGTGTGNAITPTNMPGWNYAAGVYTFDGSTVSGNPAISFMLTNNTAMTQLVVTRPSEYANFSLLAPIPEPGSIAMITLGGMAMLKRKRRA